MSSPVEMNAAPGDGASPGLTASATSASTIPSPPGPGADLDHDAGAAPAAAARLSDPERWVEEHGDHLFKFAILRLRDAARAEDLVQETFLAALKGGDRFAGRSAERSWLVGILKHKILDHYRKASRETSFTDLTFYESEENEPFQPDGLFQGGWIHDPARDLGPMEWPEDAMANLDRAVFWKAFHECTAKLPRNVAAVFTMREVDGVESREICRVLNISENNLWVMLHRARMALRRCLEMNWIEKQA
jgi:RNA polymerase sigma-70 factor (ECF subfamily)